MIEKTLIEQVVSAVNLPDYIGEIVVLQAAGSGVHEGCCPFHDEKRPSFKVYHDHYHCYGCGAHGNAVAGQQVQRDVDVGLGDEFAHLCPLPAVTPR